MMRRAAIVLIACLWPATLRAQDAKALLLDASFSKPLKWTFGGGLFLSHDLGSEGGTGTIVGGSIGKHGMQVWGGRKMLGLGGGDFRAVLTRTWNDPRGASAHSTYVGGEAGLGGLVWRFSVGYAKRVAGPSTGGDHIVTAGIGMEIPMFFGEPGPKPQDPSAARSRHDRHRHFE